MTTVIGLAPNERGAAAVHLGSMLARSVSDDVVVVTVVPAPWPPNPYRIDAEYLALQEKAAAEALAAARTGIGSGPFRPARDRLGPVRRAGDPLRPLGLLRAARGGAGAARHRRGAGLVLGGPLRAG